MLCPTQPLLHIADQLKDPPHRGRGVVESRIPRLSGSKLAAPGDLFGGGQMPVPECLQVRLGVSGHQVISFERAQERAGTGKVTKVWV